MNQVYYDRATQKNLLSDITSLEVLMMFGGWYVDSNLDCFWPIDYLLPEASA